MFIEQVDKEITAKLQKKQKRTCNTSSSEYDVNKLKREAKDTISDLENNGNEKSTTENELVVNEMSDYENIRFRNVWLCAECKISNRDFCLIVNAILKDFYLLTAQTVTDPAKIRRQRFFLLEEELEQQAAGMNELICIGFDGKHDITMTKTSGICRKVKEEHYVIISYPDRKYSI